MIKSKGSDSQMRESIIVCPHCGKALPKDSAFCQFCGYSLASKNASVSDKLIAEIDVMEIVKDAKVIVQKLFLYSVNDEKCSIQCRFQSASDKIISAVLFDIKCYDIFGNELPMVHNAQIVDLSIKRNETFENTKRIYINDSNVRMAKIVVKKVLFSDNTIVECGEKVETLNSLIPLENKLSSVDLVQQFVRDTSSYAKYFPEQRESFWICTCGCLNDNAESACFCCNQNKEELFALSNIDSIKTRLSKYATEKIERERREKEEKERQEKTIQQRQAQMQYENKISAMIESDIAFLKRVEAARAAEKRKKRIKVIVGIIIAILITVFIVIEVKKSQNNGKLRNFATESMSEDYTNVYADVVSIEPKYFVYQHKENRHGTQIGASQIWDVICKCKTVEGKTIWVSIFYQYYPGGNYSLNESGYETITYSSSNPKRITGAVDTAREVVSELETKIGNIYVLDVRNEITN